MSRDPCYSCFPSSSSHTEQEDLVCLEMRVRAENAEMEDVLIVDVVDVDEE